ncbi:hypothetical protein JMJ55_30330 [Belnapia sp. T6]|uniref:Uncharacterized protein n=1 Tax=Belnapia mucosa TaxID=2804532 RepID=A0ABS1VD43_9PROT|nr:hypothetical protein [Belnapia mucosa]MBL6459601.1 hypothetical protein [Belnapia mucosa]
MLTDLAHFEPPPSAPSATQLAAARHLTLTGIAATPEAIALVGHLTALVAPLVDAERDNARRSAGAAKLSKTVGAAVAGLLRRWGSEEPSLAFRSLRNDGFTGAPVGRRQFVPTMEALVALGFIGQASGISFTSPGFDGTPGWERRAARYWPTDKLLALALRHGVG